MFKASDGRMLAGEWFAGRDARHRSLMVMPAMATPAKFYTSFATVAAEHGWGVLLWDYRGVAANRAKDVHGDDDVTLDHWADLDATAALAELRRLSQAKFVAVVCHSIGGQLLGQSPVRSEVDGALLVASQRGAPHLFSGIWRWRLSFAWRFMPWLIRRRGNLPQSKLLLSEHVPAKAILQWIRWSRDLHFTAWDGKDREARFNQARFPVTAVAIEGDTPYAPQRAVDALSDLYPDCERSVLGSADLGHRVKHFNAFKRPESQARLLQHLDALVARAA